MYVDFTILEIFNRIIPLWFLELANVDCILEVYL